MRDNLVAAVDQHQRHAGVVERMLEEGSHHFPLSPSAFQASLQTSVIQANNRTTGAAMSLIKKADVKNHLSARHRSEIHIARPASQSDVAALSHEETSSADPKVNDLAENISFPTEPETAPIVTSKSVKA